MHATEREPALSPPVVHVVDDDSDLLHALRKVIESNGYRVKTHCSGDVFLGDFDGNDEDACVILDLRLPGVGGVEVQDELRSRGVRTPIVFITGYDDVAGAVAAMRGGAVDLLTKPFSPARLLETIRESIEQTRQERLDAAETAKIQARLERLSKRELEVLDLVAAGHSNKEVAAALGIGRRTVEIHRRNVMEKMEAESFAALLKMYFIGRDR